MKLRIIGAVLLAIFAFQYLAIAGTTGKIAGTVKDKQTGEPLIGAAVVVAGTSMGAATNLDGYYVILNIPPGKYSLVVSSVGYVKQTLSGVSVSIDLTTTQNFLLPTTIIEGEEIVIVAERPLVRKDLTSSESRVDAGTIKSLPVSEVAEVLSLQAGITTDRFGGIHIRGGRTNEVAYWVDGISISDVYDGGQAVQIDNHAVQELQVISGTFNAEYGQAMSGIVNIVTKDGDQRYTGNVSAYSGDYVTKNDGVFFNLEKVTPFATRNIEASLSGPIPGTSFLTFYGSGRYFKSEGTFYANRVFNTDGSLATRVDTLRDQAGRMIGIDPPNNAVPMDWQEKLSGQAKLTFNLGGAKKFSLSALASNRDYQDYDHGLQWIPDANVNKFERGYNISGLWTHSLNPTSFYTVNLSYFFKGFKEYLYENPFDSRYLVDPTPRGGNLYEFVKYGTNNHRFKRNTETRLAKVDYTNQLSQLHLLKVGVEGRLHRLYLEGYDLSYVENIPGVYSPSIPGKTLSSYEEYTQKPVEFSAYVQDKLEYDRMIVNVGVRFDYFDSKGKVLNDDPAFYTVNDPNVYLPFKEQFKGMTLDERLAGWYKKASAKYSISPRFGISYPITDKGVLHFSYGHFLQIPSFQHLYQKPGYKVPIITGVDGTYGNADLEPQKTVMYEIGLSQQVSDEMSFDVTGFYRDTRDWVTSSPRIDVGSSESSTYGYTKYINKDYSNSRGVTVSVNKRQSNMYTFNFSYTFQVAEGINSNPDDALGALISNSQPAQSLTALDWDQTHTANLSFGVGEGNWGAFVIGRFGSGLPYSPVINQAEGRGEDASRVDAKNSRRRPATYNFDLRAFKEFRIDPIRLNLFVKVFNVFDTRNEVDIFGQTGRATATPAQLGVGSVTGVDRINSIERNLVHPEFYSTPREIQIGFEIGF